MYVQDVNDLLLTQNRPFVGIFGVAVSIEQVSSQIESTPA